MQIQAPVTRSAGRTQAGPVRAAPALAGGGALQHRRANRAIVQRAAQLNARARPSVQASGAAPIQLAGKGSKASEWLKWGGAGLAGLGAAALAVGLSPIGGTALALGGAAGLAVGGTAALAGYLMGTDNKPSSYGHRARSGEATDEDWYEDRVDTAYYHTTGLHQWGPHTIPHVAKRVAGKNAVNSNPNFDPVAISERTGAIPSVGQGRRLLREYETQTGTTLDIGHKKQWEASYKDALARRNTGTHDERVAATRDAMELNPLSTYSLHKKATHDEIKAKGERKTNARRDLNRMHGMTKGGPMPVFEKVDFPSTPSHRPEHLHKLLRDTGTLDQGNDDLSEFELSSDDEYA